MAMPFLRAAVQKLAKGGGGIVKDMSLGQKLNVAGTTAAGVMGYSQARAEGASVPGAIAQGTVDAFLIDLIGWPAYIGGSVLMGAPSMAVGGYEHMSAKAREMEMAGRAKPFQGNTFVDNEQIYTMRQAGMAMMDQSKQNLKQAILGSEAQSLHR